MKKIFVLLYGIINYSLGSAALLYLIAFIFNLYVPWSIDSGETDNMVTAGMINISLITLFGLQHSIMARRRFKNWLSQFIPQAAERSTFMMATAIVTFTICVLWQAMPERLWEAEDTVLYYTLLVIGLAGWALVFYASFLINHFDLFGLRQVWLYFKGEPYTHLPFKLNSLYKYVRHPIMTGVFIGIWFTPVMTAGHLLFALGMSAYIMIGVYHEEKDLVRVFGERYKNYMHSTSMFFFIPGKKQDHKKELVRQ